jgi:hypothetical protein
MDLYGHLFPSDDHKVAMDKYMSEEDSLNENMLRRTSNGSFVEGGESEQKWERNVFSLVLMVRPEKFTKDFYAYHPTTPLLKGSSYDDGYQYSKSSLCRMLGSFEFPSDKGLYFLEEGAAPKEIKIDLTFADIRGTDNVNGTLSIGRHDNASDTEDYQAHILAFVPDEIMEEIYDRRVDFENMVCRLEAWIEGYEGPEWYNNGIDASKTNIPLVVRSIELQEDTGNTEATPAQHAESLVIDRMALRSVVIALWVLAAAVILNAII